MQGYRIIQALLPLCVACTALPAHAGWYVGLGAGDPNLRTTTDPATEVDGDDDEQLPWKVVVGRTGQPFSFELFHANFGDLALQTEGELSRSVSGVAGRKVLFGSDCGPGTHYDISGSIGVGRMSSQYRGVTEIVQPSAVLVAGLSASVHLGAGIAVRGQYDHFDSDTRLTSVSLIKSFGESAHCASAQTNTPLAALPVTSLEELDAEVSDESSAVTAPAAGQFADIPFNRDSSFLTESASTQMDSVARLLNAYPGLMLEVQGHSDSAEWGGSELGLSAERARRVASALAQRGVAASRLVLSGYADSRPVASNGGSNLNQRVQFRILQVQ